MCASELRLDLEAEFEVMRETLCRVRRLLVAGAEEVPSEDSVVALAAYLSNLYAGLERCLRLVTRALGEEAEAGADWHRRLLERFGPFAVSPFPKLLNESSRETVGQYLAFRHVFFHGYAVRLEWSRLEPLVRSAETVFSDLMERLVRFAGELDSRP